MPLDLYHISPYLCSISLNKKAMTQDQIKETLRLHQLWLERKEGGIWGDLEGADLKETNLEGANLEWANLAGADLRWANLQDANLEGAHLQEADLQETNLQKAALKGADLQKAILTWANLQGANLEDADLEGAILTWANLQGANLEGADLTGANLRWAKGILRVEGAGNSEVYFVKHETCLMVKAECFWGDLDEFRERAKQDGKEALAGHAITFAKSVLNA